MTDRHYNDDEVAAIFRAAAEGSESRTLPDGSPAGLTLRDLQAVAREVGISADAVSRAAQSLDRPSQPAVMQTFLGFPIGVRRTVALDRRLTDAEWELLVVELREVFRARGTLRAYGSLREWNNGNLHAVLEPTPTGYRLRLGTYKREARASVVLGAVALATSVTVGVFAAANAAVLQAAPSIAVLAGIGGALIASSVFRLPGWARLRQQQMDGIVERLTLSTQGERDARALPSDLP